MIYLRASTIKNQLYRYKYIYHIPYNDPGHGYMFVSWLCLFSTKWRSVTQDRSMHVRTPSGWYLTTEIGREQKILKTWICLLRKRGIIWPLIQSQSAPRIYHILLPTLGLNLLYTCIGKHIPYMKWSIWKTKTQYFVNLKFTNIISASRLKFSVMGIYELSPYARGWC